MIFDPDTAASAHYQKLVGDQDRYRVVVIGHSGHAYLALEYAKRYPAQVSHVALLAITRRL